MTCDVCGQKTRMKWFGLLADGCGQYWHEGRLVWVHDKCVAQWADVRADKGPLDGGRWN
jgi:hypothetical protein